MEVVEASMKVAEALREVVEDSMEGVKASFDFHEENAKRRKPRSTDEWIGARILMTVYSYMWLVVPAEIHVRLPTK